MRSRYPALALALALPLAPVAADDRYAPPLSDDEAWAKLPPALRGAGQPLPAWARVMAAELPRSTAALLQLDRAQRLDAPIDPRLRAAMRRVAARVNGSPYAIAYAEADARRAGLSEELLRALDDPQHPGWSESDRAALEFARKMSRESAAVTDDEFQRLVRDFGQRGAASMVLLMAYANFQDRLLNCLGVRVEPGGPLPPLDVAFDPAALATNTTPPPARAPKPEKTEAPASAGRDVVHDNDDSEWAAITYEILQDKLEAQRRKPTRLRIPSWEEVARNIPEELANRPSDIVWYRIVFGYAPELAVPYEIYMRTAGAESSPHYDRIFAGSLFWVTTKALDCAYCMGHCEMNWEVAGLSPEEIARRSRILAGDDWSEFPEAEQRAFAFARKLTIAPDRVSDEDVATLKRDLGRPLALVVMMNTSRYHYMTRISNGFQLTLERENVFYDYYNVPKPESRNKAESESRPESESRKPSR